jgi:hypothetical protein
MTANQREDIVEIAKLMKIESQNLARRPLALQTAADALFVGLASGDMTPEKARAIIGSYESQYPHSAFYEEDKGYRFGHLIQKVVENT